MLAQHPPHTHTPTHPSTQHKPHPNPIAGRRRNRNFAISRSTSSPSPLRRRRSVTATSQSRRFLISFLDAQIPPIPHSSSKIASILFRFSFSLPNIAHHNCTKFVHYYSPNVSWFVFFSPPQRLNFVQVKGIIFFLQATTAWLLRELQHHWWDWKQKKQA